MTADSSQVADLRTEVLAALSARERELAAVGRPPLGPADEQALGRQLIAEALERRANDALRSHTTVLSAPEEDELSRATFDALFRLNRLQRLLDDPRIENINANGCDQVWVRYADGRSEQVEPIAASDEELEEMLESLPALGQLKRLEMGHLKHVQEPVEAIERLKRVCETRGIAYVADGEY